MNALTIIVILVAALLLLDMSHAFYSLYKVTRMVPPELTSDERPHLIFLGDSVARGFGASDENKSVYGRIKNTLNITATNKAKNGNKMEDLINQSKKTNLTIAIIGSNDVFRFTSIRTFEQSTKQVFEQLHNNSKQTIIVGPGRIHEVSAIPIFLKPVYKHRAKQYEKIMQEEAKKYENIIHISPQQDHDIGPYDDMEASDNFHPNDEGHRYWFDMVQLGLKKLPNQ